MLVVTRKEQQSVRIGPDITVTVLEVNDDGKVRLGIAAPKDVQIVRDDARMTMPWEDPT